MKKRFLALILCLVMVISLVPAALAADPAGDTPAETKTRNAAFSDVTKDGTKLLKVIENIKIGACVPDPEITIPGYTIDGWYTSAAFEGNAWNFSTDKMHEAPDGVSADLVAAKPFYAKKTANQYQITFSANYGETPVTDVWKFAADDDTAFKSGYVILKGNSFTREGYDFAGWSTNQAAKEADYVNKKAVALGELFPSGREAVLYAVWTKPQSASESMSTYHDVSDAAGKYSVVKVAAGTVITIDPGIGQAYYITDTEKTISKAENVTVNASATLTTAETASRVSYGWKYDAAKKTFTAVWDDPTPENVNVSFYCYYHSKNETIQVPYNTKIVLDTNGGTYNGLTNPSAIYATRDTTIVEAKRTGYFFYGWYVTENLQGTRTFTAMWTRGGYTTYDISYYDYDDGKYSYARFNAGTTIVVDPNGGTAKLNKSTVSSKTSFYIYNDYTLSDAVRTGYTFYGWDLTTSGATYTFTAMWSKTTSTVPYMLNGVDHYAYIKGYPNGNFKPDATITRAEAASIFYRLLTDTTRKTYTTTYNTFKDVPAKAWYNTAVSTMAKLGIVTGGADGYFRPSEPITRAEIAAMIARCDGSYYSSTYSNFSDVKGHWAAGYIARAYELGWINGYGTTYAPDKYISRAETVAVLNRVLGRAPQYGADLTSNRTTFKDVSATAWYYLDVEEAANSHTYTRKTNGYEYWNKLIADPSWL